MAKHRQEFNLLVQNKIIFTAHIQPNEKLIFMKSECMKMFFCCAHLTEADNRAGTFENAKTLNADV